MLIDIHSVERRLVRVGKLLVVQEDQPDDQHQPRHADRSGDRLIRQCGAVPTQPAMQLPDVMNEFGSHWITQSNVRNLPAEQV